MKRYILTMFLLAAAALVSAQSPAIHVQKSGNGRPVLYLPGFTCPGTVWEETTRNLKGKNESHLVSYAGFNGMAPIKMPWYETIKNELLTYIRVNNLTGLYIIGHSMGGTLALDIAAEIPERIHSLVIVDALPCMRELMMPGVSADKIQYKNPYNDQLIKMQDDAFAKNAALYAKQMTNKTEKMELLTGWSIEADRETYVYGYTDLLKLDIRDRLSKVSARVLILGASFPSIEAVEKTMNSQYANLAVKTIEVVPDSRHFIFFDQPELFYTKLNTFLSK